MNTRFYLLVKNIILKSDFLKLNWKFDNKEKIFFALAFIFGLIGLGAFFHALYLYPTQTFHGERLVKDIFTLTKGYPFPIDIRAISVIYISAILLTAFFFEASKCFFIAKINLFFIKLLKIFSFLFVSLAFYELILYFLAWLSFFILAGGASDLTEIIGNVNPVSSVGQLKANLNFQTKVFAVILFIAIYCFIYFSKLEKFIEENSHARKY